MNIVKKYPVAWFVILTVALSFATYFLPLPVEQKSLLVPALMVFIPTFVSIPMALLTEGRDGLRQMLSTSSLRRGGIKWLLIGAGVGTMMHMFSWATAVLLQMPVNADFSDPSAWFILLATISPGIVRRDRVAKLCTRSCLENTLSFGRSLADRFAMGIPAPDDPFARYDV